MPTQKKMQIAYPPAVIAALAAVSKAAPETTTMAMASAAAARATPADESVLMRLQFKPPSGAPEFTILRTVEVDKYEPPALAALTTPHGVMALAASSGDNFTGTDRRVAKISIADAAMEEFADLKDLIATLPSTSFMKNHKPKITRDKNMNRVEVEKRNVRVHAFLYAASRENDNDFHLIIGRDPSAGEEMYMNVELSGLPPASSKSFTKLKTARNAYKKYWGSELPGTSYDFYTNAPRPVLIEGSLFFDVTHATGQKPGPQKLSKKIPTIWEIHPITRIKFKA
ncbi:MAG TPA: hypothetical protein VF240_03355 [Pyrinomonadaceae bacterium]